MITLPFTCYQGWITFGIVSIALLWIVAGLLIHYPIGVLPLTISIALTIVFVGIYADWHEWKNPFKCKCKK